MLTNHRRALRFSLALLVAMVFMLIAVGRHPELEAPKTTLAFVGNFDAERVPLDGRYPERVPHRAVPVPQRRGGGKVTIPLRDRS